MAAKRKYPEGTKRASFFCPPRMKAQLEETARQTERTETDVIHAALRAEFERVEQTAPEAFG